MKLKNKTQITEKELIAILQLHNSVKEILESFSETFTCNLDELSKLDLLKHKVQNIFDFAPKKDDQGRPQFWKEYVLKSHEKAYFSEYRLEEMEEDVEDDDTFNLG